MAPPSASAVGSPIGGPSPSPPLGLRAQFRRQGSSYGPSHVHHMALMVAPKRVDYSVNKGGFKSWIVLIIFVLLCSAILTIFSDETAEKRGELANESLLSDQKEDENDDGDDDAIGGEEAKMPSSLVGMEDDEEEEEEMEEEGEEEGKEEDEDEKENHQQQMDAEDEEERMLARLKEAATMARQRQKIAAKNQEAKLKARREAEKQQRRERMEEREEEDRERERAEREEEMESEEEIQKEEDEQEEEEEEEVQQQFLARDHRHGKKEKRVPSWRGTQLQAAKEDTRKPRMNLLKQRKKQLTPTARQEGEEEEEETGDEHPEDEAVQEEAEENGASAAVVGELIATRKRPTYNRKALTNRYDYKHRSLLDEADFLLEKHEFDTALLHYEQILATNKHSPRALFGRAHLNQLKAEFAGTDQQNDPDEFIRIALSDYNLVLENEDTPDELFKITVHHFVECAKILGGYHHKILQAQRALMDRFPDDADIKCDFGSTWLGMARPEKAADIFQNVLDSHPGHALALAYLGYIQKVHEDDLERGVNALRRAMRTGDERVTGDTRFYFHLGDGLVKLGRTREALEVYAEAVKHGLFPSVLQRSVHNLLGLSAHPWWSVEQSECAKQLKAIERQWTAIREEALRVWHKRRSIFVEEALPMASGIGGGEFALILRSNAMGGFQENVCDRLMLSTCEILKQFEAASCAKDKIKLSVLLTGTRTWPFCGPTNYMLEAHLALVAQSDARIRVGNETRGWRTGRFLLFDTSFEREIIFEGAPSNAMRVALTLELWHPQTPMELRGKIHADGNDGEEKK